MTGKSFGVNVLVLASVFAGSCVKQGPEGDGWTQLGGDVPITFGTSVTGPATRTYTQLSSICTSFRVFAFYQAGVVSDDPATRYTGSWEDFRTKQWTPDFMYNQTVTWSTDHWTYSPVKYWPNNAENTISFWAYAPADATVTLYKSGTNTLYGNTTPGLPSVMFTVPSTADCDFMVSRFDMVKNSTENPDYPTYFTQDLSKPALGDGVNFLFDHALCKVSVQAAKVDPDDKYDIDVNIVSIKDILFTGVKVEGGWSAGSPDRYDFEVLKDTDANVVLTGSNQTLSSCSILMPQRLNRTVAKLYVQYRAKNKLASEYTVYDCEALLGDVQSAWEASRQYTITIRISPGNPILFTSEVIPWDSDIQGFFNINDD